MPLTRRDFVRTLFVASQTALAGRLLAGEPPSGALNFAVIGDWGRLGRPDQAQVARQMALACKESAARFIISLGDNFYDWGVASVNDPHWQKSFEKIYTEPAVQVPWYVILGNHDYRGNCDAQIEYGKTHPRWIMPARYYSHVYPVDASTNLECFYIDTTPFIAQYRSAPDYHAVLAQDTHAQLAWLDQALAASKSEWKIVHGHHPIYSAGSAHGDAPELIAQLLPLLQKHGVQVYFAGHDHDLQHLKVGNLNLIVSGAGSEHRPVTPVAQSRFSKETSGFTMVNLNAQAMQVRFIDDAGRNLYTATVPRIG